MNKIFSLFISFIVLVLIIYIYKTSSKIKELKDQNPKITSFMEYRINESKMKGKKTFKLKYKWVDIKKVPPYLIEAVIISEDSNFYFHNGFDIEGIKEAIKTNFKKGGFIRGGSTITQQLAKNLFLTPEKNIFRKIKEAMLTILLEKHLTKNRIIELYLNVVEWGNGIFGIMSASEYYFGKKPDELTVEEACRLASALPNPHKYLPNSNSRFIEKRVSFILNIMEKKKQFYKNSLN